MVVTSKRKKTMLKLCFEEGKVPSYPANKKKKEKGDGEKQVAER